MIRNFFSKPALIATVLLPMSAFLAPAASAKAEQPIEAPGPLGPLKGTLLQAGPNTGPSSPIVLIIPGSGPTDRDGNNPNGVNAATLKLLAEGLAAHSISSVRIDKRGMFASAAAVSDPNAVTLQDYADDTRAWVNAIQSATKAPCVWLLGHSEGGVVALKAAQDPQGICGLILVAAPGRPLSDVLEEQLRANPANAPILDQALNAIAALKAGQRVDTQNLHPALMPLFYPAVQGFLISQFATDPAQLIQNTALPVLILQGERDIQVTPNDAERLKSAQPHAKLTLLPNTNHVLKASPSDSREANIATYAAPNLPLAPGVVEAIVEFVRGSE